MVVCVDVGNGVFNSPPTNSVVLVGGYTRTRGNLMQNAKLPHPVQCELTYPDENLKILVEVLRFKAFYKTK